MIVHLLREAPPPSLAAALDAFERQFRYPLGPGRSFRIEHGLDYPRFFRAMGDGVCFVTEQESRVTGVIGVVLRRLSCPDGAEKTVLYIGDLKLDPAARGGRTLLRLAEAVRAWVGTRVDAAYGVVMDRTSTLPPEYSGRLGIPAFGPVASVTILRIPTAGASGLAISARSITIEQGEASAVALSPGQYLGIGGDPRERSEAAPTWLLAGDGRACGRLEDTLRAKRLIADDESEMRSAHLSCFAYADVGAGVALLRDACAMAAERGLPALFVAVDPPDADALCTGLQISDVVVAPATVYGTGFEPGASWNISTAEI